jgi:AcrR family transcriptional regulator
MQSPSADKPRRIDAQRNRARIIRAAFDVLGNSGVDAQMTDIAQAAGLGVGTVYRNFASKEELVNALVLERLQQGTRHALRAAAEDDAWGALEGVMRGVVDHQLENRVLSHFLAGRIAGSEELREQRDELYSLLAIVIRRAQKAGQLRADVGISDIRMAMMAISRVASSDSRAARDLVVRFFQVILDGLRAPARTALPGSPPSISKSEEAFSTAAPGGSAVPGPLRRGRRRWPDEAY